MVGNTSEVLIKILDWASDPAITNAHVATCLVTENLQELNTLLVQSPYNTKIKLPMPDENELADYCRFLSERMSDYHEYCKIEPRLLGAGMLGLTKAGVNSIISFAIKNKQELNPKILSQNKKSYIEKECNDLLEFIESPYNLDMVAGHRAAKKWLKEDAELIRNGKLRSIPMGYLLTGGIGTGKTFLANCWAGELGIPFVKFKNFRDKWQGSTEGNLEKIFTVLDALGQVIVFIDEADQSTGKREGGGGDSGVSGRVYSMLAQKMSDTKNRGKIIWILATSRPDLLEVDLKRQGRLDVHIPLFAPQTDEDRNELFKVVAKKSGSDLKDEDIPEIPAGLSALGGNEMEALLVRANRQFDLHKTEESLAEILKNLLKDFRPSAYTAALEYMDLIAVKECTDSMFLPEKYKTISPEELDERIEQVKHRMNL
jgi:SpoVK/Ycf46/Vps4 family AAA+-type ATPase